MPRRSPANKIEIPPDETAPADAAEPAPEEYEVRRQALLAKLPPKEQRPTTLVGKLALVTSVVGEIKKTGENKFHGYKYARESDLVEAIRPLLAELGVWLHSTLSWDTVNPLNPLWIGHERVKIGEAAEIDSLTILMVAFHFIDGGTGERTPIQIFPGYGDDTGDKGAYKALTGAEKYFLMKTFLVSTGDDPEADSRADDRAAARDAKTRVQVGAGPAGQRPARHGGRQSSSPGAQTKVLGETLRAAGFVTVTAAIEALSRLTGKTIDVPDPDKAVDVLQAFIKDLSQEEVGNVIRQLKETPAGVIDEATDAAQQQDAAAEAADIDVRDGGTEATQAADLDAGPYA